MPGRRRVWGRLAWLVVGAFVPACRTMNALPPAVPRPFTEAEVYAALRLLYPEQRARAVAAELCDPWPWPDTPEHPRPPDHRLSKRGELASAPNAEFLYLLSFTSPEAAANAWAHLKVSAVEGVRRRAEYARQAGIVVPGDG